MSHQTESSPVSAVASSPRIGSLDEASEPLYFDVSGRPVYPIGGPAYRRFLESDGTDGDDPFITS